VKATVSFDDAPRTVTMNLVRPWGPFLATLAGGAWASVIDKDWAIEQGDWDGDCATWQNFYGIPSESGIIRDKTNGTGPYRLDHWSPNDEIVLVANPNYRKGEAALKRIVIKNVIEFGTRFAALQAGDADSIALGSKADEVQMDTLVRDECNIDTGECATVNPNGILRAYHGLVPTSRTNTFFTFQIAEGSTLIGSGQLDGSGIPPDFFSDPSAGPSTTASTGTPTSATCCWTMQRSRWRSPCRASPAMTARRTTRTIRPSAKKSSGLPR